MSGSQFLLRATVGSRCLLVKPIQLHCVTGFDKLFWQESDIWNKSAVIARPPPLPMEQRWVWKWRLLGLCTTRELKRGQDQYCWLDDPPLLPENPPSCIHSPWQLVAPTHIGWYFSLVMDVPEGEKFFSPNALAMNDHYQCWRTDFKGFFKSYSLECGQWSL